MKRNAIVAGAELVKLLTRKDVARLAGVSTATIKRDVKAGLLEEIRFNNRRRRYHPDAVAAYLAAQYPHASYRHRTLLASSLSENNK
jgi:predicted site-specific integrase-resolvase